MDKARLRAISAWPVTVAVNALVGYAAVLPMTFVAYAVGNLVLHPLGLAERDADFAEEQGLNTAVAVFGLFLVVGVFGTVNGALARVFRAGRAFWPVAAVVVLAPTAVVLLWPQVWQVIRWY